MKVALDISPMKSGHQVRGIGSYTKNLLDQFQKEKKWDIEFEFFENHAAPPPADVVHYPYFDLFFRTLPISKTAKRVVTIHDVIPLVFPNYFPAGIKGYVNLFFQKIALKNSDAIICDSKTSKNDICDKLSVPSDKVHVIYLASAPQFHKIDPESITVSKRLKLPKDFVLYVGDVNWNKNIDNLLQAIKISQKNLVMVGKAHIDNNLAETQQINKIIHKLKIGDKVVKVGFVDDEDLVEIYNIARLTLLPSYYEGFGLPAIESMACGTPLICSNVASLSEITDENTIYCEPTDPVDIAGKIDQVYSLSQKEKGDLSKKLIKHASAFSWEKVARQTISVYKALI